jgi:hypothetical protein
MQELTEELRTVSTVSAIICDKCSKRIVPEDWMEWQEAFHFGGCGGYGSPFGDSEPFSLDLCQECWHGLVGNLVQYKPGIAWLDEEEENGEVEDRSESA